MVSKSLEQADAATVEPVDFDCVEQATQAAVQRLRAIATNHPETMRDVLAYWLRGANAKEQPIERE